MSAKQSTDNRAVALVRFSPRPLPEEAKSLEVQSERIASYAAREGLEIVATFKDPEVSARRVPLAKRTGGAEMLAYIDAHKIRHVVIAKLDRAFRDTLDGLACLKRWKKQGIALHLADQGGCSLNCNTATGELVLTFLLGVASFEPRQTAERTSAAMKHRQKNGLLQSGRAPFGFARGPDRVTVDAGGREKRIATLVDDASEQELRSRIVELRQADYGLREIARRLMDDGLRFRGGKIHHTLIRSVLAKEKT